MRPFRSNSTIFRSTKPSIGLHKLKWRAMANKTRYTDAELEEFDQLLDDKIEKARNELSYYQNQIQELADADATKLRGLDDATGAIESERLQVQAARQSKHIKHLENAKLRVKNKTYGICRETGALISKGRLKAVPHATLSIAAKQRK